MIKNLRLGVGLVLRPKARSSLTFVVGLTVFVLLFGRPCLGAGFRNLGNLLLFHATEGVITNVEQLPRAEQYLEHSIAISPSSQMTYRSLAEVRILEQNYAEAREAFALASTSSADWALFQGWGLLLRSRYLKAHQDSEAQRMNLVLTSSDPKFSISRLPAQVFYQLGRLDFEQKNYADAVKMYGYGISVDSKSESIGYEYQAEAFLELGEFNSAARAAQTALADGGGPHANMLLGQAYQSQGNTSMAESLYRTAVQQSSRTDWDDWGRWMAYFYLGWIDFDRGDDASAFSNILSASQIAPGTFAEPQALKYLGEMYYRRGRLPEAITEYERAIALSPAGWDWVVNIHMALANAYRDSKQKDAAIQEYRVVLRLIPGDAQAIAELGTLGIEK